MSLNVPEGSMNHCGNGHDNDNALAESLFPKLKREHMKMPAAICLMLSKGFITVDVGVIRATRCHRQHTKDSIINDPKVSGLSVETQSLYLAPQVHCLSCPDAACLIYLMDADKGGQL
jgi:hypothetical protein